MSEFVFLDVGRGDHLFRAAARRFCRNAFGKEQVPLLVRQAEYHQGLQRARHLLSLRMDAQGRERPNAQLSALNNQRQKKRLIDYRKDTWGAHSREACDGSGARP